MQYLNEAYAKEKQLETALQAHISMTGRASYKKRLRDHLKETKAQARGLERDDLRHRQIARKTLPVWLFVSVTGVIVYLMLYRLPL